MPDMQAFAKIGLASRNCSYLAQFPAGTLRIISPRVHPRLMSASTVNAYPAAVTARPRRRERLMVQLMTRSSSSSLLTHLPSQRGPLLTCVRDDGDGGSSCAREKGSLRACLAGVSLAKVLGNGQTEGGTREEMCKNVADDDTQGASCTAMPMGSCMCAELQVGVRIQAGMGMKAALTSKV